MASPRALRDSYTGNSEHVSSLRALTLQPGSGLGKTLLSAGHHGPPVQTGSHVWATGAAAVCGHGLLQTHRRTGLLTASFQAVLPAPDPLGCTRPTAQLLPVPGESSACSGETAGPGCERGEHGKCKEPAPAFCTQNKKNLQKGLAKPLSSKESLSCTACRWARPAAPRAGG